MHLVLLGHKKIVSKSVKNSHFGKEVIVLFGAFNAKIYLFSMRVLIRENRALIREKRLFQIFQKTRVLIGEGCLNK